MTPLEKARVVIEVRKQYESAESREERIRLARLLEQLCWEKEKAACAASPCNAPLQVALQ